MKGYTALFDPKTLRSQSRNRLVVGSVIGVVILCSLAGYNVQSGSSRIWLAASSWEEQNPFSQPGYLHYDREEPLSANWIPFDSSIAPAPDWPTLLREAAGLPHPDPAKRPEMSDRAKAKLQRQALEKIPHLRNTTLLLIGDSVDRNIVIQTSELLGVRDRIRATRYDDIHDGDLRDWDTRGVAHHLYLPNPVDLTVANCFVYGLDDHDEFSKQIDWHAPGKAEDRIEQLCKDMTSQLAHEPSVIQLHSGLWDCSYFARIDRRGSDPARQNADQPLTREQMDWWQRRMISIIRKIKQTWPNTPIVYRKLHRPHSPEASFAWTSGQEALGYVDWFADVRVAQIREMQEVVARAEGLWIFDFGHIWEGFQPYQDAVHPQTMPGGVILNKALMHYAYMISQAAAVPSKL